MARIALLFTILSAVLLGPSCAKEPVTGGGSTPTEAYKKLYAAVKSKDIEAIKSNLTKRTIELAEMQSSRAGTPIERVFENGFTETTFAASLPAVRDERVKDKMGALEVWNSSKSLWEDVPFMLEDGTWKLAVGDIFAGGYRSPGKGRGEREKEAANAVAPQTLPAAPNVNASTPRVIDPPSGNQRNGK